MPISVRVKKKVPLVTQTHTHTHREGDIEGKRLKREQICAPIFQRICDTPPMDAIVYSLMACIVCILLYSVHTLIINLLNILKWSF